MANQITVKFIDENDVRFIILKEDRFYTLKFQRNQREGWIVTIGNLESNDHIPYLLEILFQNEQTLILFNELQIPMTLPVLNLIH